jgi:hypothetical protein
MMYLCADFEAHQLARKLMVSLLEPEKYVAGRARDIALQEFLCRCI